jgi:hypothetical protein
LIKFIQKTCKQNESELLTPQQCTDLLTILVSSWHIKLGTAIERKIEQSIIAARAEGELVINDLINIANLLSIGDEGEPSFWKLFEECL